MIKVSVNGIAMIGNKAQGSYFHECKYESQASFPSIAIPFVLTFTISYLAVFIISDYKNLYLPSILHLYHHLVAKLVHLYNLPLYWICWGHKRIFVIWLQVYLRDTIFILHLPRIDKPQVIHLREICYCPTNLSTWRPNNIYKKKVSA